MLSASEERMKRELVEELMKEPIVTVQTAFVYAKNYLEYGIDATEKLQNTVSWTAAMSKVKYKSYVEAYEDFRKDYNERFRTDMVAMLEEIKDEAKKLRIQKARENVFGREFKIEDYDGIIQSKIDKLKGGE